LRCSRRAECSRHEADSAADGEEGEEEEEEEDEDEEDEEDDEDEVADILARFKRAEGERWRFYKVVSIDSAES
jgi:hypothetical protein